MPAYAYAGVEIFRRWSLRRKIFDIPNQRSSHTTPTPRGGGLPIVVISLTIYTIFTILVTADFEWSYLIAVLFIVLISWLDDVYSISFVWRFLIHSLAALLVIVVLGYFREIQLPYFGQIDFGVFGPVLTFVWIVWLTNAYNFMDGIDGLAGIQAVSAGIGWMIAGDYLGFESRSFYGGVLAFSCLGFLIQNWHPARIFMGDVGSAFLGFNFAVLPFLGKSGGESNYSLLPTIAFIFVWFFIFDTVLTFVGRVLRKEKFWQAHREHIYQRLVIRGFSHEFVTALYGIFSFILIYFLIRGLRDNDYFNFILPIVILIESVALLLLLFFKGQGEQPVKV